MKALRKEARILEKGTIKFSYHIKPEFESEAFSLPKEVEISKPSESEQPEAEQHFMVNPLKQRIMAEFEHFLIRTEQELWLDYVNAPDKELKAPEPKEDMR